MVELAPLEPVLVTGLRSNYARAIGLRTANLLNDVLFAHRGIRIDGAGSCASCTLDLVKRVGTMYFATKEAEKNENHA